MNLLKFLTIFIFLVFVSFLGGYFLMGEKKEKIEKVPAPSPDQVFFEPKKLNWEEVTSSAPWSGRDSHWVVVFHDQIFLMGGVEGGKDFSKNPKYGIIPHKSDIWKSKDGINWERVREDAPWGKRRSAGIVELNGKLYLMGGWRQDFGETKNDVWISEDGERWKLILGKAPWEPREGHSVFIFQNKIFLLGGVDYYSKKIFNDVWVSEDGINWTKMPNPPWTPRYDQAVAVFQGKIWMVGGMDLKGNVFKDVWMSEDGENWKLITENPPWPSRHGHLLLEYKNYLWLISGWSENEKGGGVKDVWYSKDGIFWERAKTPKFEGREDHQGILFQDSIWIFGGMADQKEYFEWKKDVWRSSF
jgi:hypothetical protein